MIEMAGDREHDSRIVFRRSCGRLGFMIFDKAANMQWQHRLL
jgi:hypothetical protein